MATEWSPGTGQDLETDLVHAELTQSTNPSSHSGLHYIASKVFSSSEAYDCMKKHLAPAAPHLLNVQVG